jgi:hypothetical protein
MASNSRTVTDHEDMMARLENAESMMRANGWNKSADAINRARLVIQQATQDQQTLEAARIDAYAEGRKDEREDLQQRGALTDCAHCDGIGERPVFDGSMGPDAGDGGTQNCPDCDGTGFAKGCDAKRWWSTEAQRWIYPEAPSFLGNGEDSGPLGLKGHKTSQCREGACKTPLMCRELGAGFRVCDVNEVLVRERAALHTAGAAGPLGDPDVLGNEPE